MPAPAITHHASAGHHPFFVSHKIGPFPAAFGLNRTIGRVEETGPLSWLCQIRSFYGGIQSVT